MEFQDVLDGAKTAKGKIAIILSLCTLAGVIVAFGKPMQYTSKAAFVLTGTSLLGPSETAARITVLAAQADGVELHLEKDSNMIEARATARSAQEAQEKAQDALNKIKNSVALMNERQKEKKPEAILAIEQKIMEKEMLLAAYVQENGASGTRYESLLRDVNDVREVYRRRYDDYVRTLCSVEVIVPPSLPDAPEKPRRTNAIVTGLLCGVFLSFFYSVWLVRKKRHKGGI